MLSILIVDDHPLFREGAMNILNRLLSGQLSFEEAVTGQEALEMVTRRNYNLVMLDINLPDTSGLEILKQLRKMKPSLPIVVLSSHPEEQYAVRALRAGASGYVNKGSSTSLFKATIERALSGAKCISTSQAELLEDTPSFATDSQDSLKTLSEREYQMVCLMTRGFTLTEIARELDLSISSVSTYKSRVLEKLNLRTTADIIKYSVQHSLCT